MQLSLRYVPASSDGPWPMNDALDDKTYPNLFVDDEQPLIETKRMNYDRDVTVLSPTGGSQALDVVASEPVAVLVADH